jgi:hypothetical protein
MTDTFLILLYFPALLLAHHNADRPRTVPNSG